MARTPLHCAQSRARPGASLNPQPACVHPEFQFRPARQLADLGHVSKRAPQARKLDARRSFVAQRQPPPGPCRSRRERQPLPPIGIDGSNRGA
jgi:hypothetical protein